MSTGNLGGSAIPAGWYHDPLDPQTSVRYWSGTSWTQHSQPIPRSTLKTDPEQTPIATTDVSSNGQRIGVESSPNGPPRDVDHTGRPGWANLTGPPHPRQWPYRERGGSRGWYPNPSDRSQERYWNGSSWEDNYRSVTINDPLWVESSETPSNDQSDSGPRMPGYTALSSLLTKLKLVPDKSDDHGGPTPDRQRRNALIALAGISVLLAILFIGEQLGLIPDETTAAPTSAAAIPSMSATATPSPTSTPSVSEPAPTATQDIEPALTDMEVQLLAMQIKWSQMSRSDRRDFCVAYVIGGDEAWDVFDEQNNGAVSKEAYLTFFGERC